MNLNDENTQASTPKYDLSKGFEIVMTHEDGSEDILYWINVAQGGEKYEVSNEQIAYLSTMEGYKDAMGRKNVSVRLKRQKKTQRNQVMATLKK